MNVASLERLDPFKKIMSDVFVLHAPLHVCDTCNASSVTLVTHYATHATYLNCYTWDSLFSFILMIHEGSHREVYQEFQPSYDIFRCQGLFRPQVPWTPNLVHYPIANSASTQSQQPV